MEDLIFSIKGKSKTLTQYEGKVRQFKMVVDEPENLGGELRHQPGRIYSCRVCRMSKCGC